MTSERLSAAKAARPEGAGVTAEGGRERSLGAAMHRLARTLLALACALAPAAATAAEDFLPEQLSWDAPTKARLDEALKACKAGAVAVFDADGTIWADDVGEAFLRWLIAENKLKGVDPAMDIYAHYEHRVKADKGAGYAWAVQVMAGLQEADVKAWAEAFFRSHFDVRVYGPQKALIAELKQAGCQPWIVSASSRWIVQAGAPYVGVDPKHVVGIEVEVANGVLTDKLKPPITYKAGKVDAIRKFIGRTPVLVSGDSSGDQEMLEFSQGVGVLLIHEPQAKTPIAELARRKGWIVQYFPLLEPWQAR